MDNGSVLKVFTDGGARGNPGPAAIGVVIKNQRGEIIHQKGQCIGQKTNNEAEYYALIYALQWLKDNLDNFDGALMINFFLDSKMIVNQMAGNYKVKAPNLKPLFNEAKKIEIELGSVPIRYSHIQRDLNKLADRQVNLALDGCLQNKI